MGVKGVKVGLLKVPDLRGFFSSPCLVPVFSYLPAASAQGLVLQSSALLTLSCEGKPTTNKP